MRRTRRASLTASLAASLVTCVAVAIPLTAVPASAAEYWNDYTVSGLPAFVTAPTPFSITVDGPDAVCGMTYADVALASAPWTFQFDPSSSERHPYVDITLCDGGRDYADVDASVPFRFADRVVDLLDRHFPALLVRVEEGRLRLVAVQFADLDGVLRRGGGGQCDGNRCSKRDS